jgi:hypothetical protein
MKWFKVTFEWGDAHYGFEVLLSRETLSSFTEVFVNACENGFNFFSKRVFPEKASFVLSNRPH